MNFSFEAPSGAINNLHRYNNESISSLYISWDELNPMERHGLITDYRISYIKVPYIWDNAPVANKTKEISASHRSFYMPNLENFTRYQVFIVAANSAGYGPGISDVFITPENCEKTFVLYLYL